jgi:Ca2+-binding RTX toxin-like protein
MTDDDRIVGSTREDWMMFKKMLLMGAALGMLGLAAPAQGATYYCWGKKATIVGTYGADKIKGTPGQDVVAALGGADTIAGRGAGWSARDYLCGGRGADTIYVQSKAGFETCAGGVANVAGGKGQDQLFGGGESFNAAGNGGDDLIYGCNFGDQYRGVSYWNAWSHVRVQLRFHIGKVENGGTDKLKHINSVMGSRFNDTIQGTDRGALESLSGGGGDDDIDGFGGPDNLFGGPGHDQLDSRDGVVGNDILDGEDDLAFCEYDTSDEGADHAVNCDA